MWGAVKRRVAEKNTTYKLRDVEELTIKLFNEFTKEEWKSCVEHVKRIEEKYMRVKQIMTT